MNARWRPDFLLERKASRALVCVWVFCVRSKKLQQKPYKCADDWWRRIILHCIERTAGAREEAWWERCNHQRQVRSFFPSRVQTWAHTWATQSPTDRPTSWQRTFRRLVARSEGRELNWNNQNQKVKWKVGVRSAHAGGDQWRAAFEFIKKLLPPV